MKVRLAEPGYGVFAGSPADLGKLIVEDIDKCGAE
jgi:hypothetical protein